MIKVSNLSKIFRTEEIETTALNGVSFEIKAAKTNPAVELKKE